LVSSHSIFLVIIYLLYIDIVGNSVNIPLGFLRVEFKGLRANKPKRRKIPFVVVKRADGTTFLSTNYQR
jgi:hypothetical protein